MKHHNPTALLMHLKSVGKDCFYHQVAYNYFLELYYDSNKNISWCEEADPPSPLDETNTTIPIAQYITPPCAPPTNNDSDNEDSDNDDMPALIN